MQSACRLIMRAGVAASLVFLAACGSTGSGPTSPPTAAPAAAPGEIRLHGTIVGHADPGEVPSYGWRTIADATMDVHLRLSPDRALVDGTVSISSDTTGDCLLSDSGDAVFSWDSIDQGGGPDTEGKPWGDVEVYTADPRYFPPGHDMNTVLLSVGAGFHRGGGTCGHSVGPVYDTLVTLQGDPYSACEGIELVLTNAGTWEGECHAQDDTGWEYASIVARFTPEEAP